MAEKKKRQSKARWNWLFYREAAYANLSLWPFRSPILTMILSLLMKTVQIMSCIFYLWQQRHIHHFGRDFIRNCWHNLNVDVPQRTIFHYSGCWVPLSLKTAEEHGQWVPANGKRRHTLLLKPTKYVECSRGSVTWLSQISVSAISKITVQKERLKQSSQAGHAFANVTSEV